MHKQTFKKYQQERWSTTESFFESFEDFYTFFIPNCKMKILYFMCKFSTSLWFCSGVYFMMLDSELTRATNKCFAWIMKSAVSHFIFCCISQTVYFALILFCSTEEGGYFGWWGSSADPAAAVIQPWLCNSLELQKRDPNAYGNCEVSFTTSWKVVHVGYGMPLCIFDYSMPAAGMRMICRRFMR